MSAVLLLATLLLGAPSPASLASAQAPASLTLEDFEDSAPRAVAVWVDAARLQIDGEPDEWTAGRAPDVVIERIGQLVALGRPPGELWDGPGDASLRLWLGWTREELVIGGEVRDQTADYDPSQWHRGDSLELFLNLRDRAPEWGSDDFQVMLAPDWVARPWGVYAHAGAAQRGPDGGFGGIEIVSRPFLGGYRFEARLPWRNFAGHEPRADQVLAFNFAQCDRDARGPLESYGTWTGEAGVAAFADRRGSLVLAGPPMGAPTLSSEESSGERPRVLLLILLAVTYGLALVTRRVWRRPRAMRRGLVGAALILALAGGAAGLARFSSQTQRAERRAELEAYGSRFEALVRSGALGRPESELLRERVADLLADRPIAPVPASHYLHLAPEGGQLGPLQSTARRGLPYRRILPGAAAAAPPGVPGIELGPGGEVEFALPAGMQVDALQLITQVADARILEAGLEQVSVLAVEFSDAAGAPTLSREVRHIQDLHHQEDEHEDRAGLEPAFYAPGGPLGRVHADGILLELDAPLEATRVRVRRVGPTLYDVRLLALAVRTRSDPVPPVGIRETSEGEWRWSGWRAEVAAEVTPMGRAPKTSRPGARVLRLLLGSEPVGLVHLSDLEPPPRGTRWDSLPLGALFFLSPFLVALTAEWLATRRRIRGKLAVGFAVSSAVPLLALTLLLEASLGQEHELDEGRRARTALVRAERDLEQLERVLTRDAQRLLRIVELEYAASGAWPEREQDLEALWGASDGALRLYERTTSAGRRQRLGSGAHWREVPGDFEFESGLQRPWGRLYVCGVARTAIGAEEPLSVVVARPPPLADSRGAPVGDEGELADVRLIGAGSDPRPELSAMSTSGPRELRRPLFGPSEDELLGVLVAGWGERGVPVLGDYTLTELLLAAGLTALFTALLFAGILTGHLVGPIERLDRAVREGRAAEVVPEVEDEVGHLTRAIRSASSELDHRVRQLEILQVAQEDLSRQLDADRARESVLRFFDLHAGARSLWITWRGESGEVPRLFGLAEGEGEGVRSLSLPAEPGLLQRTLAAEHVLHFGDAEGLPALGERERSILGPVERVLSLPLLAAGGTRGALLFGYRASDPEPDLAFLRAASAQAAIVLENARLYQQAVSDGVTGFLFDAGFRQRLAEEIQRAEGQEDAGVLVIKLRLSRLPEDDRRAAARLREASQRLRLAVRGIALFGRAGAADLSVAIPWSGPRPSFAALERRLVERVASLPWPDGAEVSGLFAAHAAWPTDGPSARFVLQRAEERLSAVQTGAPLPILEQLRESLPADFVAGSPSMMQMLETVRRLAEQEVTLLVSGETGTGKDRLAELAHRWSPRRSGSLVHVHCPSLSETLIEDELFGHEMGAFTGAHNRRVGPFEFAAGGTVVLDEVAGLSNDGQVALLRVLESREVLPLGAQLPVAIDVRVIATTSRDLAAEVEAGRFRSDLYFRLNVAQVTVPPLRLRRPALPELVLAFVKRFNATAQRPVTGVDPEVLDLLFEHDWPGNVRELENVLARGLILAGGGTLRVEHVDLEAHAGMGEAGLQALEGLNLRQKSLLEELRVGASIRSAEYAERHGVTGRTALRDLQELADSGWLVREGQRRGTRFLRTRALSGASSVQ